METPSTRARLTDQPYRPARGRGRASVVHGSDGGATRSADQATASAIFFFDVKRAREIGRCKDPEPKGQLAALLEPSDPQASLLRDQARAGYDALPARHPQAFADHAARLFALSAQRSREILGNWWSRSVPLSLRQAARFCSTTALDLHGL